MNKKVSYSQQRSYSAGTTSNKSCQGKSVFSTQLKLQISNYHQGSLTRLKDLCVRNLWRELKKDPVFMSFFPDSCFKRVPEKTYFWKIFTVLKPDLFNQMLTEKISNLKEKSKIKDDTIKLTYEAQEIFENFKFDSDLALLG